MPISFIAARYERRHVHRPGGTHGPTFIVLHEDETKNAGPMEYELPPSAAEMLWLYVDRFRPQLAGLENSHIFPGSKDGHKGPVTLSSQITERIAKHTGLRITPQQFRHLAAKLFLSADPGNFEGIRRPLGHKNM